MLLIDATYDHTRAHMVCARSARFYRVGEVLQGRRGFYAVPEDTFTTNAVKLFVFETNASHAP